MRQYRRKHGAIMFKVNITFTNKNPDTIWGVLAKKLGREPTHNEACAEVKRILSEAYAERTTKHDG